MNPIKPEEIYTYDYVYGSGNISNRRIQFFGDGKKIWGTVQKKVQGSWKTTHDISEIQMSRERASTSEKVRIMLEARKTFNSPQYPPNQPFNEMTYDEKSTTIKQLKDKYRISITNSITDNPYHETIKKLVLFDPS